MSKVFIRLVAILLLVLSAAGCNAGHTGVTNPSRGEGQLLPSETKATTAATENTTVPTNPEVTTAPTTPDVTEGTESPVTEPAPTNSEVTNPPAPVEHTHSYTQTVVSPTCTSEGYTQYRCSCGSAYNDALTASLGHNYTDKVIAPTTESQGYTEHVCGRCGHSYVDGYTDKIPAPTEPTECQHNWEAKWYPEQGHYTEHYCVCKCGFRFDDPEEWGPHLDNYWGTAELVLEHTSWATNRDWIVDSPERWEWVCSKCGEVTNTQP